MILITILTIMALMSLLVAVFAIAFGGTAFIIVFGDVVVCVFIIVTIIRALMKRKKR